MKKHYSKENILVVDDEVRVGQAVSALLEKLGGDSLSEMRDRFSALRHEQQADLEMDNVSWRF